jgi:hypothetical protein
VELLTWRLALPYQIKVLRAPHPGAVGSRPSGRGLADSRRRESIDLDAAQLSSRRRLNHEAGIKPETVQTKGLTARKLFVNNARSRSPKTFRPDHCATRDHPVIETAR